LLKRRSGSGTGGELPRGAGASRQGNDRLAKCDSSRLAPEHWRSSMYNILTIIGVIVVALAVLAFFGLR
jgi:hypothetical protein